MKELIKTQTGCQEVKKEGKNYIAIFLKKSEIKGIFKNDLQIDKTLKLGIKEQREIKLKSLGI